MTEKNHQERNKYYCILTQYLTRCVALLLATSPTRGEVITALALPYLSQAPSPSQPILPRAQDGFHGQIAKPPKPTARKIKPPLPPSMGIEKEFDTRHPIRQDTTRTKY